MAYSYNYNTGAGGTSNPGNVKIQNVVVGFNKRTGKVVIEFDARGLDWNTGDVNNITASLLYGGAVKVSQDLTINDTWKRQTLAWEAGKDAEDSTCQNLQDLGSISITLRIDDENDSRTDTAYSISVDLDPSEYHLTLLAPPSFGDASAPSVEWQLTDLFSEQKITPVITVGASTTNSMTVTLSNKAIFSASTGGYIILNGVKFSESSLVMNTLQANKAHWIESEKYTIIAPTMSEGDNTWSLALNCTAI